MSDFYKTLGISEQATEDDIKKAYRKLAKEHHPDKGGDTKTFQTITEAYNTLKDPKSRQEYDLQRKFGPQYHFNTGNPFHQNPFDDIFSTVFNNGGYRTYDNRHKYPHNQDIQIQLNLTLEEIYHGTKINRNITFANGKQHTLNVDIPPGINSGDILRFPGQGEDVYQGPKGALIIIIQEMRHNRFIREGAHLILEHKVNVLDLIIGTSIDVETIDNKNISIKVPAGTQPSTTLNCPGKGMPILHTPQKGNLFIRLIPVVPKIKDIDIINKIIEVRDTINE